MKRQRLQEVSDGCFVLEEVSQGQWERIDFFDDIYIAAEIYHLATGEALPPDVLAAGD